MRTGALGIIAALALLGCGDGKKDVNEPGGGNTGNTGDTANAGNTGAAADPNAEFGPLEKGADYASWTKLNTTPVKSKTHGGKFVDTYVNDVGLEAYKNDDADIPVGAVIVKTSKEPGPDGPTEVDGPIFVMARVAGDGGEPTWWYALHWAEVPESWQGKLGADKVYWRTPSKKVGYCSDCHDNYPRELGGIPKDARSW